jgi:hypothetical protein
MLAVSWRTRILKSSTSWRGALPSDCLFGSLFAPLRLRSGQGPGGGSRCRLRPGLCGLYFKD